MDIDLMDEFESPASQKLNMKRPAIVPIDDNHPFDLDAYINTYSGAFLGNLSFGHFLR